MTKRYITKFLFTAIPQSITGISTGSRFRGFLVDPIKTMGPWLSLDMAPAF